MPVCSSLRQRLWGLVVTNTAGVAALKLTCPTNPGANTTVRSSAPLSQRRPSWNDCRLLGLCPAPTRGAADITALYTAKYGAPSAGKNVYVQVNQFIDSWEDLPASFSAIVPATV